MTNPQATPDQSPGAEAGTSVRIADKRGLLIGTCAANTGVYILHAIVKVIVEENGAFPISSFGAALICGFALILTLSPRLNVVAAQGVVAALVYQVLAEMMVAGAFENPVTPVFICILPVAILMVGTRSLPFWAVVSVVGAIVVGGMDSAGYIPALLEPIESRRANQLVTLLTCTCGSALMCWYFFRQAEVSVNALDIQRQHFEYQANHDHLTGLPNRAQFEQRAESMLLEAKAVGRSCNLYFLDINGFKPVNDTYGHSTGDKLLIAFAERIKVLAGDSDLFARLAGDEFVLLTNAATADPKSAGVGDQIKEVIAHPFEFDGHDIKVGVSVGVARFPRDGESIARLLLLADQKMYEEKDALPKTERRVAVEA